MSLIDRLLDLLFPPQCPFCGGTGKGGEDGPCAQCVSADFWVPLEERVSSGENVARWVCVGWYRDELRRSVRRFKFQDRPQYAEAYGRELARTVRLFLPGTYDCLAWMPVSKERLAQRGYDQAKLLAEALGRALDKPVLPLLEKRRDNPAQSSLAEGRDRWKNVSGVYCAPDPAAVAGRRVLLVDDIRTTGATLEEGARVLRAAGAAQVVAAVFCRTPEQKRT